MINSFFNKDDEKLNIMDDFVIPVEWWSRNYEYKLASNFLNENDICIDAGCGINHPFKNYASKRVKKLFAIDNNIEITNLIDTDKLEHLHVDLKDLAFSNNSIDKIFCISVLEHIKPQIPYILEQFKRILKNYGLIILTLDYPTISPNEILNIAYNQGFKLYSTLQNENIFEISDKNIISSVYNLRCFNIILQKDIDLKTEINILDTKKSKKNKKGGL